MNTINVEQLNKEYGFDNGDSQLSFVMGEGGIPLVEIVNQQSRSTISLQGAHVLSWIPAGEADVIWLSEAASFAPGKSVRGGIPLCWPWFGPHQSNNAYPAHGFARTVLWQVTNTRALSATETEITFALDTRELDEGRRAMWPLATLAEYRLTISKKLSMELITTNYSDQSIQIGQALHTYFNIADIGKTSVLGLEGKAYLDKTDGFKQKTQKGVVLINAEVDRVYLDTVDRLIIDDQTRKISIDKLGSQTTVVWNPWQAMAEKMGDLGKDGYRKMLCVESANAANDTINIAAGDSHSLRVSYAIEAD